MRNPKLERGMDELSDSNFYMTQPLSPVEGKISNEMMSSYCLQNNIKPQQLQSFCNNPSNQAKVIEMFSPKEQSSSKAASLFVNSSSQVKKHEKKKKCQRVKSKLKYNLLSNNHLKKISSPTHNRGNS